MVEYIVDILTKSLLANGLIKENEKNIYFYSIQVLIEKIIGFSAIFLIAFLQRCLLETVLFILCFSKLRKCTGGFHASKFSGCFAGTIGIYIVYLKFIFPLLLKNIEVNMIMLIASGMVIFILGAVNHPNMDWNKKEYEENKILARMTVLLELMVIVALTYLRAEEKYILFMSFGVILCAILLTLGKIIGQEVKCYE